MISKYLMTAFLASTLMTGVASAQTTTAAKPEANAAMHREGQWRASKLVGVDVYNQANEKVGDISDVILDKSGKVANVVLGVGGFLGMGEHYVAVSFDKLKWVNEPVRSATTSTTTNTPATADGNTRTNADGSARTTTGTATTTTRGTNDWYPDHVVINASKDELKGMPQFKY